MIDYGETNKGKWVWVTGGSKLWEGTRKYLVEILWLFRFIYLGSSDEEEASKWESMPYFYRKKNIENFHLPAQNCHFDTKVAVFFDYTFQKKFEMTT